LSENEALKLELNDAQSRHQTVVSGLHSSLQSVEHENKGAQYTLHQNIRHQQDRVLTVYDAAWILKNHSLLTMLLL
jgi:hypothetical protein